MRSSCRIIFKDFFSILKVSFLIFSILISISCQKKSTVKQSGVLPSLQNSTNPEGKSFLRIFDLKDGEVYVNEVLIKEGNILFPMGFFEGGSPYMGRNTQTSVYPLDLVMRIYLPDSTHSNQDFYFEIPVLGPHYEISSLSSALTRFLRYEITPIPKLSYLQYEKILYSLKVNCNVCIKLPSSEILKEIRFSQFYQQMIFSNLANSYIPN